MHRAADLESQINPSIVAPAPMKLIVALFALVAYASAFSGPASVGDVSRASVAMSTKFTDPYVQKMKKKNPKTGSTTNLKGYTVGSRAPPMAVSSGTRVSSS